MSLFNPFGNEKDEYQLVVVLQDDQACWFRWREGELVGSFLEPMEPESFNQQTRCPWVQAKEGGAECQVRLVLDTCLDEVDRVKAEGLSEGWMQRMQRLRMASRLQSDYPLASIHPLSDYALPDVLSIVHHLIPPGWEEWLRLLQLEDVCITHAVTSLELLCGCSQDQALLRECRAFGDELKSDGPVLFNVAVGNERRHLLADSGIPLFMRMVSMDGIAAEACDETALQESLQHVREQITHSGATPPVLELMPRWPELDQKLQTASVLATLCIGSSISLQCVPVAIDDESTSPGNLDAIERQRPAKSGLLRLFAGACARLRSIRRRRGRYQQWRLTEKLRFASDVLQPSICKNSMRLRIQQLQRATLACALMAAASVAIASTHGINSALQKARLSEEQHRLSQQADRLTDSVLALNEKPEFVLRSLARIEGYESVKPIEAIVVLSIIAKAVDESPFIVLDRLTWSVLEENQSVDLAFADLSQVTQRDQLWQADSSPPRLRVEISGSVLDQQAQGLREQQRVFEFFVEHLQSLPEVTGVNVLESPVSAAQTSHRVGQASSGYHLSLQMGEF